MFATCLTFLNPDIGANFSWTISRIPFEPAAVICSRYRLHFPASPRALRSTYWCFNLNLQESVLRLSLDLNFIDSLINTLAIQAFFSLFKVVFCLRFALSSFLFFFLNIFSSLNVPQLLPNGKSLSFYHAYKALFLPYLINLLFLLCRSQHVPAHLRPHFLLSSKFLFLASSCCCSYSKTLLGFLFSLFLSFPD